LLPALGKMSSSLETLKLSHTALTARGINKLAETLMCDTAFVDNLHCLDLSDNSTKGEDITVSILTLFIDSTKGEDSTVSILTLFSHNTKGEDNTVSILTSFSDSTMGEDVRILT